MKTFVTFVNGYQEVANMAEAIVVAKENDNTNFIVEVDESKLPEGLKAEECLYAEEDGAIKRTTL
jgi:hypothetical protein